MKPEEFAAALLAALLLAQVAVAYIPPPVEVKAPPGSGFSGGDDTGTEPTGIFDLPDDEEGEPGDNGGGEGGGSEDEEGGFWDWLTGLLGGIWGWIVGIAEFELDVLLSGDKYGVTDYSADGKVWAKPQVVEEVEKCYLNWGGSDWEILEPGTILASHTFSSTGNQTVRFMCADRKNNVAFANRTIETFVCKGKELFCEKARACLKPSECLEYDFETDCRGGWPLHGGEKIKINHDSTSCDLFEVTSPTIEKIAQDAKTCCENDCSLPQCHGRCNGAVFESSLKAEYTIDNVKKCSALYAIYGLGPQKISLKDYFWPELCCHGSSSCQNLTTIAGAEYNLSLYYGTCEPKAPFNANVNKLPCNSNFREWRDDLDMTKNTCNFVDVPAHVSTDILETGTCVDYSVVLTSVLRRIGYSESEVYSVTGPGHEYNMIKLAGENRWHIVDTVNNMLLPYQKNSLPGLPQGRYTHYCEYKKFKCVNDDGQDICPLLKFRVWGC